MVKVRLDQWLVDRGYFPSRQQAQRAIQAGAVTVDGDRWGKSGSLVDSQAEPLVQIRSTPNFVSRGGDKLAGALRTFPLSIEGRICLDGGISTGGFTDCLLQRGAAQVWGVDVGYGQVAWKLQTDPRVVIRERCNLRYLTPAELYGATPTYADLATLDLAFISLTLVLPALWHLLRDPKEVLALVKPQFEAGREQVGKKGVVRDPLVHTRVIERVWQTAAALGWSYRGLTWSPIRGPNGNIEYWLWLALDPQGGTLDPETLSAVVRLAHSTLTD